MPKDGLVVGYARVSTEEQGEEERAGFPRQRQAIEEYCLRYGLTLARIYEDTVSGGADEEDRPQLYELLADAKRGLIWLVVLSEQDRLARTVPLWERLNSLLAQYDVLIKTVRPDDPPDREPSEELSFQRTVMAGVAQLERAVILRRTSAGRSSRLARGHVPAGRAAWGYRYRKVDLEHPLATWEVDPALTPSVEHLFRLVALGEAGRALSLYEVAHRLDAALIPTPAGKAFWSPQTVAGIVRNPAYKGQATYNRWQYVKPETRRATRRRGKRLKTTLRQRPAAEHRTVPVPAIIAPELWQAANNRLTWAGQHLRKQAHFPYLLSGLLHHSNCQGGQLLVGSLKRRAWPPEKRPAFRAYMCPRCHRSKSARILDNAVWTTVAGALLDLTQVEVLSSPRQSRRKTITTAERLGKLDGEIANLRERIDTIEDRWAQGQLDDARRERSLALAQEALRAKTAEAEQLRQDALAQDQASEWIRGVDLALLELLLLGLFGPAEQAGKELATVDRAPAPAAVRELLDICVERIDLEDQRAVIVTTPILARRRLEIADVNAVADARLHPYSDPLVWLHRHGLLETRDAYDEHLAAYDQTVLLDMREALAPWRLTAEDAAVRERHLRDFGRAWQRPEEGLFDPAPPAEPAPLPEARTPA